MSQLLDYVLKGGDAANDDLNMDINNMDFNFDAPDMMTSEFFDSVMSLEKDNFLEVIDDKMRFFNDDLLKDDASFAESTSGIESPSTSPSSTHHNSPRTDSDIGSNDSDNFHEQITLFGSQASETLTSDDYYSFIDQASMQNEHLQQFIADSVVHTPVVNNVSHKLIKRVAPSVNNTQQPAKKFIVTKSSQDIPLMGPNAKTNKIINNGKNQVIRVQAGGRSLLLPVNVKDIKKLKVIRANELNMEALKFIPAQAKPVFKKVSQYAASTSSESVDDDIDLDQPIPMDGNNYPALELTGEEKRLLMKEGIKLPTHYPLTKYEEKELKRIRRKIRNKISAQDSRKRKKEYVDQLEEKARKTDEENELLKSKVKNLNRENTKLSEQLKKLQELLCSGSSKATPTTCLMIVLFSTLLVCLPNLRTAENKDLEVGEQQMMAARRALLFNPTKEEEDQVNMDEFIVFNKEEAEARFEEIAAAEEKDNGTAAFVKYLGDLSAKYESIIRSNCTEILQGGSLQDFCKRHEDEFKQALQDLRLFLDRNKGVTGGGGDVRKFIEPDISDDEEDSGHPPSKRTRLDFDTFQNEINSVKEIKLEAEMALPSKRE